MGRRTLRRLYIQQRAMGLCLLAISSLMLWLASSGTTPEQRDATALLFTIPLGLYLLTTKHHVIL
ncbi:hypothetical protein B5G37_01655 [Pseudoflavonifractor sp. An85]|nr:hypothetical protein B5G37_01655 [Pseudoflavonifractor sp. An85]